MTKKLHFAGYDFQSGPEGTVINRPQPPAFSVGDRVEYRDVNLWDKGTVESCDSKWVMVRWDRSNILSKEWAANLEISPS